MKTTSFAATLRNCLWLLPLCGTASLGQTTGAVTSWGDNTSGQCTPGPVGTTFIAAAAGQAHSLALKADGTVVGWGFNTHGQATVPPNLSGAVAVAAREMYSLALRHDGTVVGWGLCPQPPAGLSQVRSIAAGYDHCLALKADGTVVSWGSQTDVPAGLQNVTAIAAGYGHSLAVLTNGTVVAWGDDAFDKLVVPASATNVIAVAAGEDHCLALKRDGTVVAWGANYAGQSQVPAGLTNVLVISAGSAHNLALKANGTLAAWGDNSYNQCSVIPTAGGHIGIAAGYTHSVAVQGNGQPALLQSPADQTVWAGQPVRFEAVAVGNPGMRYQWQLNGTNIAGATSPTLVIANPQAAEAGIYTLTIMNSAGWVKTAPVTLTIMPSPPVITKEPEDLQGGCADIVRLAPGYYGSAPMEFQWFLDGQPLPTGTNGFIDVRVGLTNVGLYSLALSNSMGAASTRAARLSITNVPPALTSPTLMFASQGHNLEYRARATRNPTWFTAEGLPEGLWSDRLGVISGTPVEDGSFAPVVGFGNDCTSGQTNVVFWIDSARPYIEPIGVLTAQEGVAVDWVLDDYCYYGYYLRYPPEWFDAQGLPPGLAIDPLTGAISGVPSLPGDYVMTATIGNYWGENSASFQWTITPADINELSITDVSSFYSSPYLLDLQFSLRNSTDPMQGDPVVAEPRLLSAECFEDETRISGTETGYLIQRGSAKVSKTWLLLDFSESVATLANGDENTNGLSDAVEFMVSGAQLFVKQQPSDALIGVYEFHREDRDPQKVIDLSADKDALNAAIAGIWTNFVKNFTASSRCWDGLKTIVEEFGPSSPDERHTVICVSDGNDQSSTATVQEIIDLAATNQVRIWCVGFGQDLSPVPLTDISTGTGGKYLSATNATQLAAQFALVSKEAYGQYILRWPTLRRTGSFSPWFRIHYQGLAAESRSIVEDTNILVIDTNTVPPTTNFGFATNLGGATEFKVADHEGDVTVGALRLVSGTEVGPASVILRAGYVPRHIRKIRIHYRPNWPCTTELLSTNLGEIMYGWTLSETNDSAGGRFLTLSGGTPLKLASFGNLVKFTLRDIADLQTAFSVFEPDNSIYADTGGQTFDLPTNNLAPFLQEFPALPHTTPVPWLQLYGFTGDLAAAELSDPDNDGAPTWWEYLANTHPNDPDSCLRILDLRRRPNHRFEVVFPVSGSRFYRVESSYDLVEWTLVAEGITGREGRLLVYTDPNYNLDFKQIFYRLSAY